MNKEEAFQRLREEIHCNPGKYVPAGRVIEEYFSKSGVTLKDGDEKAAFGVVNRFSNYLLKLGKYHRAAQLFWSPSIFTIEPYSVREIWKHLDENQQAFIVGGGDLGKSRTTAAWLLCYWLADPIWTFIKMLSVNEAHAATNIFAAVKNFHAQSSIRMPGEVKAKSITYGPRENSGFHIVAIPQGDNGGGRLRGCHPEPRPVPHETFGSHSRSVVALDEAELVGVGAFKDFKNIMSSEGADFSHVKIIAVTNPEDRDAPFGQLCEPVGGWNSLNPETAYKWEGKDGIQVLRLDGAKTENVLERRMVHPGFMTHEGFDSFISDGENTSEYWAKARGFWAPSGTIGGKLMPADLFDKSQVVADYVFVGQAIELGALDTALEGGDDAVFTHGRFGFAQGVRIPTGPNTSKFLKFPKNIPCLLAINRVVLPKGDAVMMGQSTKQICEECGVRPENLILDAGGNGSGVHAWLKHHWTPGQVLPVVGIDSGSSASDMKIFLEEGEPANEKFKGMHSELAFGLVGWLEFGYLKLGKKYPVSEIRREITQRQYLTQAKLRIVEPKRTFKTRTKQSSPDRMDSLALLVHRARMIDVGTMRLTMARPEGRVDHPVPRDTFFEQDAGTEFIDVT